MPKHCQAFILLFILIGVSSLSPSPKTRNPFNVRYAKSPDKKKIEAYTKVKRLKQMISTGKGYQDYLDEQKRYENPKDKNMDKCDSDSESKDESEEYQSLLATTKRNLLTLGLKDADPVEVMKKVVKYQQDKIEAERRKEDNNC